jgi:hypothetical protein
MIGLDCESLVPPLPEPPGGFVLGVMPSHVRRKDPLHPHCEISRSTRLHDKMDVIGHQAGSQYWQLEAILRAADERLELSVIIRRVKDSRLPVAAIQHVIAAVTDNCPSRPWHRAKIAQSQTDSSA